MDDKILEEARKLLQLLIDKYGPWGTVGLVAAVLLGFLLVRLYKDWRADKAVDRALAEKERSIQRLANQERTSRRLIYTQILKLDPAEVDRLLQIEGDYDDAKQARKAIESKKKRKGEK